MNMTVDIPTLETERLILRPPKSEDTEAFIGLYASDRAKFIGGPNTDRRAVSRAFGHIAGLWVLRGYSSFVAEVKGGDGSPVGSLGPWHPYTWPELEFGWTLWSDDHEGKGYVTEAMRTLIPWTWERTGLDTAISIIDDGNDASVRVAEALGATFDADDTERHNAPNGAFGDTEVKALIYRHRKGALR